MSFSDRQGKLFSLVLKGWYLFCSVFQEESAWRTVLIAVGISFERIKKFGKVQRYLVISIPYSLFWKKKREWLFNIKGKNYLKSETFIEWKVLKNHRILVILKDFLGGQLFYCVGKYDPRTLSGSC